jgi:hypothetical protein
MTREITLSVDVSEDGTIAEVTVACPDEITTLTFINAADFVPDGEALRGDFGRMLVDEHLGRCSACQRWEARVAS